VKSSRAVKSIRAEIMALPQNDRLDYAIDLLERMMPVPIDYRAVILKDKYGLAPKELKIVVALNNNPKHIFTRKNLYYLLYGDNIHGGPSFEIVNVYICKIRRKIPHPWINTVWGVGFTVEYSLTIDADDRKLLLVPEATAEGRSRRSRKCHR
jgi:DNA-binding response OmpR family regulator